MTSCLGQPLLHQSPSLSGFTYHEDVSASSTAIRHQILQKKLLNCGHNTAGAYTTYTQTLIHKTHQVSLVQ